MRKKLTDEELIANIYVAHEQRKAKRKLRAIILLKDGKWYKFWKSIKL
jgi:hypothetical protein